MMCHLRLIDQKHPDARVLQCLTGMSVSSKKMWTHTASTIWERRAIPFSGQLMAIALKQSAAYDLVMDPDGSISCV